MFWGLVFNAIERYWKVILIAVMAVIIYFLWNQMRQNKADSLRNKTNYEEAIREADSEQKKIVLEAKDFREQLEKEYAWVLDSLNKKPREVVKIQYIKTTDWIVDTTEILKVQYDTVYRNEAEYESCGLSVKVSWEDSIMSWDIRDTNEYAIATYKNKSWFQFWKKKEYTTEVVNKCSEEIIANESYSKIKKK